jgi:hypothetical protein
MIYAMLTFMAAVSLCVRGTQGIFCGGMDAKVIPTAFTTSRIVKDLQFGGGHKTYAAAERTSTAFQFQRGLHFESRKHATRGHKGTATASSQGASEFKPQIIRDVPWEKALASRLNACCSDVSPLGGHLLLRGIQAPYQRIEDAELKEHGVEVRATRHTLLESIKFAHIQTNDIP